MKQTDKTCIRCAAAAEPLRGLCGRFPGLEWEQDEDGLQYLTWEPEKARG